MKKKYIVPTAKEHQVKPNEIICTSVKFGNGTTDSMNARGENTNDDFWEDFEW